MTHGSRKATLGLLAGLALVTTLDEGLAVMPIRVPHACAGQAADLALALLERRAGGGEAVAVLRDKVETRDAVKAPDGTLWLDVIEVPGTIAERAFRVRVLYAQGDKTCLSRGSEVIDRP